MQRQWCSRSSQSTATLTVPPGAALDVVNEGSQVHNLYIEGDGNTADLASGDERGAEPRAVSTPATTWCTAPSPVTATPAWKPP